MAEERRRLGRGWRGIKHLLEDELAAREVGWLEGLEHDLAVHRGEGAEERRLERGGRTGQAGEQVSRAAQGRQHVERWGKATESDEMGVGAGRRGAEGKVEEAWGRAPVAARP